MHKELSVKSRVRGDFHARFCERVRVKLPRSTRPDDSRNYIQSSEPPNMVCRWPSLVCRYLILYFQHPTTVKNHLQFRTFLPKALHNPNKCLTFAALEPPSLLTMLKSGVVLFLYHYEIIVWQVFQESSGTGSSTLKSEPTYLSLWPMVCRCPTLVCKCRILYLQHPTSVKNRLQFRTFSSNSLHNLNKCFTFAATVPATPLPWMRTTAGLRVFIEYM